MDYEDFMAMANLPKPGQWTTSNLGDSGSGMGLLSNNSRWADPAYLKSLGYTGPTVNQTWANGWGDSGGQATQSFDPQLMQWIQQQGLTPQFKVSEGPSQAGLFNQAGQMQGDGVKWQDDDTAFKIAMILAGGVVGGAAAGVGGLAAGGAGAAEGGAGAAVGNGAFLGEGVASGVPAWDTAAGLGGAAEGASGLTAAQQAYTGLELAGADAGGLGNLTAAQVAAGGAAGEAPATAAPSAATAPAGAAPAASVPAGTVPAGGAAASQLIPGISNGQLLQTGGGLLGAAIGSQTGSGGALSGLNSATSTAQNTIDPRMSKYLYGADGSGGLLAQVAALQAQQAQNGGLNATQHQGIDMQKAALLSPGYTQGLDQMRSAGSGLLGGPMAGNPFTSGQASLNPAQPAQQPMQVAPQAQVPGWQPMQTQLNQQRPQMTGLLGNLRPYGN
jgi:hypothetical protein